MSDLRQNIATLSLIFLGASTNVAQGFEMSDLQHHHSVPDNKYTNCAREAMVDHQSGQSQIMQETIQDNEGQTVYQFLMVDPGDVETHIDIIQNGPQVKATVFAMKGDAIARSHSIQRELPACFARE